MKKIRKLFEKGDFAAASNALDIFLKENPNDTEALLFKGKTLCKLKKYQDALIFLLNAFEKQKTPETEGELGVCYYCLKKYNDAQIHLISSIVEKYDEEYAKILEKALLSKHNDEAMLGLKLLVFENNPKNIHALRDITSYAQKLKKFDIALSYFDILLSISPDDYVAWNNIGLIYEELGDWQKAFSAYKKALSLKDFFSPNFNLGIMSRKMHKFDDSIKYLKKAVVQNPKSPQPKYSLSMSYMMLKDFKNGYPLYSNHMSVIMPYYYKNEWDGTMQMEKTLCIFTTGGLGDMIMYARYFKYLKGQFKKIYILLPETLHKIFKRTFSELEILNSSSVFIDYDYAIAPMHILKLFNLDFNRIVPDTGGFLKADEGLITKFKNDFFNHDKLKIAINWHGNREGTRTFFNRSMPVETFEPLFEKYKEKAVFYSIQKDDSHIEAKKYPNVVDMYDYINDFDDTAAILKNADFLVSIDSSPVHMAGALGVKTFVLLPFANEWRWFNEGEKTLWYDSVTLLRQDTEGNWQSAMEKLLQKI